MSSSAFNSRIRGKKVEFLSEDEEKLISIALSLIWLKPDKKIDSCVFEKERVRISYKKNEGRVYFDLQESLSGFTFIDKVNDKLIFSFLTFLDNFVHFFFVTFYHFWTILSTFFFR